MDALELTVTHPAEELAVLTLAGEIDLTNCGELSCALSRLTAGPVPRSVVVDLTGVRFLAVCGVRCLALAQAAIERAGGRMRILLRPETWLPRRVLELGGRFELVEVVTAPAVR
ncbi:STAS domain-containing protein [Pseudonocardia kujensis]|uniref:STAS domain-containing protein n=1 Tax=Pseudonocardia kujensis TaxID=1128675 RepID=UPI001E33E5C3|nr:STAS domain-containing protein [Pseudonocardia kujensis]MCE0766242.1 STAS domain-containing protein [Pseudonocardia kujensis]